MNDYPALEGLTAEQRDIVLRHVVEEALEEALREQASARRQSACAATVADIIEASRIRTADASNNRTGE